MSVRSEPRSVSPTWISVLLMSVPVAVVAAGASFVRPIVDDHCYEARIQALGVLGTWSWFLSNWSGTWLQHLGSTLVAAPSGYWAYGLQSLALLLALLVACQLATEPERGRASVGTRALATIGLGACALAALQGSLVGPAYPGLAGTFAFPAAGLLHLLPLLIWLPLTMRWWSRPTGRPPLLPALVVALLLTGMGIAESLAAALVWGLLALLSLRTPGRDARAAGIWLTCAAVVGVGLLANYLSPGSRNRAAALAVEPSSAALTNGPLVDFPLYVGLYAGGILTSPGVWAAGLLGLVLALRSAVAGSRADTVALTAVPALVVAQAAAAVFAYPAFWHLQPVQVAAAVAAFALGRRFSARVAPARPAGPRRPAALLATAALVTVVALPPALATQRTVATRADALDAAVAATKASAPGQPAVPAAYAIGRRDGAVLPDAGAGDPGYGRCWAIALGREGIADVPQPAGPRGVLPTLPLPILGQ